MFKKISYLVLATAMLCVMGCSDNDDKFVSKDKTGPKPEMDLMVVPDNYKYGDKIDITGLLTDERNLEHYELLLLNSKGDTYGLVLLHHRRKRMQKRLDVAAILWHELTRCVLHWRPH